MMDTSASCCTRSGRASDLFALRSKSERELRRQNLAEFRAINRRCEIGAASDLTARKLAAIGGTEAHIRNVQRFANEIGVALPITGKLDAWTMRFCETFQTAYSFGEYWDHPLTADGLPGPLTNAAIEHSRAAGHRVTTNFRWAEYVTKNPARTPTRNNPVIMLTRELAQGMQNMRTFYGVSCTIISAFRDPFWNARIGGATSSQHLLGKACDFRLAGAFPTTKVLSRWFNGLGVHRLSGRVSHADVRAWVARWFYSGR